MQEASNGSEGENVDVKWGRRNSALVVLFGLVIGVEIYWIKAFLCFVLFCFGCSFIIIYSP